MKNVATLFTACALSLLVVFAPTGKGQKAMAKSIDCSDAKEDIAALEKEKASTLQRVAAGARFIVPVAVVVNIFQEGSGSDKVKERKSVASGDYNKAIDAKIAEIKQTCGL